jgi:hypothetical protein
LANASPWSLHPCNIFGRADGFLSDGFQKRRYKAPSHKPAPRRWPRPRTAPRTPLMAGCRRAMGASSPLTRQKPEAALPSASDRVAMARAAGRILAFDSLAERHDTLDLAFAAQGHAKRDFLRGVSWDGRLSLRCHALVKPSVLPPAFPLHWNLAPRRVRSHPSRTASAAPIRIV